MTTTNILSILKIDLQLTADAYDTLLIALIQQAERAIRDEGIVLTDECIEDQMLIEQYAAYMFRRRRDETASMPRFLRWQLNNRLMHQKMHDAQEVTT